jgi:hypothetical protein
MPSLVRTCKDCRHLQLTFVRLHVTTLMSASDQHNTNIRGGGLVQSSPVNAVLTFVTVRFYFYIKCNKGSAVIKLWSASTQGFARTVDGDTVPLKLLSYCKLQNKNFAWNVFKSLHNLSVTMGYTAKFLFVRPQSESGNENLGS